MTRKVLDVMWFSGPSCIGVVKVRSYDEIKFYIGVAPGTDEDYDKQYIADYGSRFPNTAGVVLLGGEP